MIQSAGQDNSGFFSVAVFCCINSRDFAALQVAVSVFQPFSYRRESEPHQRKWKNGKQSVTLNSQYRDLTKVTGTEITDVNGHMSLD